MTIVVAYVPRPEGRAALDAAIEQARLLGSHVLVVNTSRGERHIDPALASEEELATVKHALAAAGVTYEVAQYVTSREVSEEIVETAASRSARLLVIGIRRRTPTGKFLFGSTAQRVLLEASCPVLAVKGPVPS